MNIVTSGFGCHLSNLSMACLMYADDLVLSASVFDLQHLFYICSSTDSLSLSLSLKFNCQKSCCLAFDPRYNDVIEPMNLGIGVIDCCSNVKYLIL